jgi:hypothetical protein
MSLAKRVASLSPEELAREYIAAVTALTGQNASLTERNEELRVQNDWLKRQLFGKKSERILPSDNFPKQLALGEGYEPEDTPPPRATSVQSYERSHRNDEVQFAEEESRLKFDETVPVEVVNVANPAIEGLSEDEYEVIGEEVTHKVAQRPGAYVVLKYVRPKVRLKSTDKIITAPVTSAASVIERSIAEASFLAGLHVDKFLYHLPLNRKRSFCAYFYPQIFQVSSTRSRSRCNPRQITISPGGGSFFLAKYPPSLASATVCAFRRLCAWSESLPALASTLLKASISDCV